MALSGERLLIAATLDGVKAGETFDEIPAHMSLIRWHTMPERWDFREARVMDSLFDGKPTTMFNKSPSERAVAAARNLLVRNNEIVFAHRLENINDGPSFALRAFVHGFGQFDPEDEYNDIFYPHITDTAERILKEGDTVTFGSVALIATFSEHQAYRVIKALS